MKQPSIQQLKKVLQKQDLPYYAVHDDKQICGFFGPARFLSNFWHCKNGIIFSGLTFKTVENAFQSAKVPAAERYNFLSLTCKEAKILGKQAILPTDWEETKFKIMEELVTQKFTINDELKQKLLETGNKHLEERNCWWDCYWGTNEKGIGQNNLGKILMAIRDKLKL